MLSDNTFQGIGHFQEDTSNIGIPLLRLSVEALLKSVFAAFVHYGNSTAVQCTSEVSKPFASFSASKWMLNQCVIQ